MYFDSHAHYYDEKLKQECTEGVDSFIDSLMTDNNICGIINVGTDIDSSLVALKQAMRHSGMYAAAGIHPSDCKRITDMQKALSELEKIISENREKVVALGEIGLDYYWEPIDKGRQKEYLHAQLDLAERLDIPVIIHDRDAHGDCFDAVSARKNIRGVFHSYSGSAEMAKELVRRGWYISFSGTITFKNAERVRDVARALPYNSVLIETDCPYLTPHPFRGKTNHSGYIEYTNAMLASVWNLSPEETAGITARNAKRLFGIKG